MPLLNTLKQLSVSQGHADDLTGPCLKLYDEAMIIAKRIEQPNKHGYLSPAQIAPHFEQLLYNELKKTPLQDKKQVEAIKDNIQSWQPAANGTQHGEDKNTVIKETLIAVLNRLRIDAAQAKSAYFHEEKIRWRREFLDHLESCFTDDTTMANAFNDIQPIKKAGLTYTGFTADELPAVFQALDATDKSPYAINDERMPNTLANTGFSSPEINTIKKSDVFRYAAAIKSSINSPSAEYPIILWLPNPNTVIEEHKLYVEILNEQESIRYYVNDATGKLQQGIIKLKVISDTLIIPVTQDQLKIFSYAIFDNTMANGHTPKTLSKLYRNLAKTDVNDAGEICADQYDFQAQLSQVAKPYIHYQQAREALLATMAKPDTNITLKRLGQTILEQTDNLKNTTPVSLYELTNTLKIVNKTMSKPTLVNAQICSEQGKKIAEHSTWKKVGSALLIIAGVATILASLAVALFSFGALSPVSVLGVYLGASLITGGVAIGAGVLGAAAVTGGAKLTKTAPAKSHLRNSLTTFAKEFKTSALKTTDEPSTDDIQTHMPDTSLEP